MPALLLIVPAESVEAAPFFNQPQQVPKLSIGWHNPALAFLGLNVYQCDDSVPYQIVINVGLAGFPRPWLATSVAKHV
ncbi:MAG TPA: hypothetical protein VGL91_03250 [Acidobacteriota bacterium]